MAEERGAQIKYVFETHFHADFVSGHVDLAKKTGAKIVYGPTAKTSYDIIEANDGEIFELGKIKIKLLHTPGHTPESSCYLLHDEDGKAHSIYTGDTLFIGDVGRPDLAQKNGTMTPEDMAGTLYDSLREKIMPLPDHIVLYPGHGAGSACGKNMSDETTALLGDQKQTNYALGDISKEDFIKELTTGILPPPQYFPKAAMQNKQGYKSIDDIYSSSTEMSVEMVQKAIADGALVVDTRHEHDFEAGHVPGSWFFGLDGNFAPWAGALITDLHQPLVLITEAGREDEATMRLARVGFDNVLGYLGGGIESWENAGNDLRTVKSITPDQFVNAKPEGQTVDVRLPSEYDTCHVNGAELVPLDFIHSEYLKLDMNRDYLLHCKGGYRSVIFWSIMASKGYSHLTNIRGGFDALKEAGADVVMPELA